MKQVCVTLDLEADHAGHAPEQYFAWEQKRISSLLALLKKYQIKLSIFVVGNTIEIFPKIIKQFQQAGCDFHLHSHTHNQHQADSLEEITRGKRAFQKNFSVSPVGYRAPEGRITPAGWQRLADQKFKFDASIINSIWPHPKYLQYSSKPSKTQSGLIEIPFTTLTLFRIPFELSWIKLIGWEYYQKMFTEKMLPETIVCGFHLHDLWKLPAFDQLSLLFKPIYNRNVEQGMKYLEQVFISLQKLQYSSITMTEYYQQLASRKETI